MISMHDDTAYIISNENDLDSPQNERPPLPPRSAGNLLQKEEQSANTLSLRELLVTQLKKMHLLESDHRSTLAWILRRLPEGPCYETVDALHETSWEFSRDTAQACKCLKAPVQTLHPDVAQLAQFHAPRLSLTASTAAEKYQYLRAALQIAQTQVIEYGTARNAAEVLSETELTQLLQSMLLRATAIRQRLEHLLVVEYGQTT